MVEFYLISFILFLVAGILSHDRSVTNPPKNDYITRYGLVKDIDTSDLFDFTTTTASYSGEGERWCNQASKFLYTII